MNMNEPTFLKVVDVARRLGNSPSAVTRWIMKGASLRDGSRVRLEAIRTPGGWRVTQEALDAFFATLTEDRLPQTPSPTQRRGKGIDWAAHDAANGALEAAGW